jgi:hypothetical protein
MPALLSLKMQVRESKFTFPDSKGIRKFFITANEWAFLVLVDTSFMGFCLAMNWRATPLEPNHLIEKLELSERG